MAKTENASGPLAVKDTSKHSSLNVNSLENIAEQENDNIDSVPHVNLDMSSNEGQKGGTRVVSTTNEYEPKIVK